MQLSVDHKPIWYVSLSPLFLISGSGGIRTTLHIVIDPPSSQYERPTASSRDLGALTDGEERDILYHCPAAVGLDEALGEDRERAAQFQSWIWPGGRPWHRRVSHRIVSAAHGELAVRRLTDTLVAAPVRTCHQQDVELAHSVVIATDFILGSSRQGLTLEGVSFNESHSAVRLFYPSLLFS